MHRRLIMIPTVLLVLGLAWGGCGDKKKSGAPDKTAKSGDEGAKPKGKITDARLAWGLGAKLSLTALGHGRGVSKDVVGRMMKKCAVLAKALGTTVPPLPSRTGQKAKDTAAAMHYLMATAGRPITRHLAAKDPKLGALFELAIKLRVMSMMYSGGKGDRMGVSMAKIVPSRAKRAGLPDALTKPLLDLVTAGASQAKVQAAVQKLFQSVDAHLAK